MKQRKRQADGDHQPNVDDEEEEPADKEEDEERRRAEEEGGERPRDRESHSPTIIIRATKGQTPRGYPMGK